MAITKLMNIKQGKMGGGKHLSNSIRYIMNPKKTEDGKWIGGNAGVTSDEVYQMMMDTKMDWDKLEGRQGYHFVISFKPGEATEEIAYQVLKEFCEEYLGDNYDYVFSIHNDHDHMHGHIVFNSVNRISGYKYRYENGDWEKKIQPITDKICERHGLPPLEFDPENRNGKSYAQWEAEKNGKPNWKKIIRADIDYIISISSNETEFLRNMEKIGYHVRKGNSEKHGIYYAFRASEQKRAWRSYKLGNNYYILPSSKHELLIVLDDGSKSVKELREMVQYVNEKVVSAKDLLSDKILHYNSKEKVLELAVDKAENLSKEITNTKQEDVAKNTAKQPKKTAEFTPRM